MAEIDCLHFNGYKPCGKSAICTLNCGHFSRVKTRILVVHLEALGAVLRSTSLLQAIQRQHPQAHITWLTKAPAHFLLENNSGIHRVLTTHPEDILKLSALHFDLALVIDKSLVAEGLLRQTSIGEVRGFRADPVQGVIVPANPEARELWNLGLSDTQKFFVNQKSEQQLVHESLALGAYRKDEYSLTLTPQEKERVVQRRKQWGQHAPIVGINTGCSAVLPHKKLSLENHRQLIQRIRQHPRIKNSSVVLLGGPEDTQRNLTLAEDVQDQVHLSPTTQGLRDGLVSVAACDLIMTGDSLGMHMAIALKKWVVAWFGPSVAAEIELYGRGRKIVTDASCSPCWKRVCQQSKMCYDQLDLQQVVRALDEGWQWHTSSSKPHSPEISFSPSPF